MCEAIFKILRFGKSLELISTSYQLLNELDRVLRSILFPYICFYSSLSPHGCMREFDALILLQQFPRVYMMNTNGSSMPHELVVVQEVLQALNFCVFDR